MQDLSSQFLASTDIIDWHHRSILSLATRLASGSADKVKTAKNCFDWVRDNIRHSSDYQLNPVTCTASDVLKHATGYCYAKSHLLAALLRANKIPAGFCYQRLSIDDLGPPFCLHGFNAIDLPNLGWYRVDARGNRAGIQAEFCPPKEQLAFAAQLTGEQDWTEVLHAPLPIVVDALRSHKTWDAMLKNLPDAPTLNKPPPFAQPPFSA